MTVTENIIALLSHKSVWIAAGIVTTVVLSYYTFAAYVSALEPPNATSTIEYRRKYMFLNYLAKELKMAAKEAHIPVPDKTAIFTTEEVQAAKDAANKNNG